MSTACETSSVKGLGGALPATSSVPTHDCRIEIRIDNRGDLNIYNCSTPPAGKPLCNEPPRETCPPTATGACVPYFPQVAERICAQFPDDLGTVRRGLRRCRRCAGRRAARAPGAAVR
jgi:hypothetical protein